MCHSATSAALDPVALLVAAFLLLLRQQPLRVALMGDLRDGRDDDEVEEQLEPGGVVFLGGDGGHHRTIPEPPPIICRRIDDA